MVKILFAAAVLPLAMTTAAEAQLFAARDNPIAYGHHHINATDVSAHERFWVDGLGGARAMLGDRAVISFPNVIVFLTERAPTGGTKGSVVNHVGFEVPDIRAAIARLEALGFPMVSRQELPNSEVVGHVARAGANQIAYVMGPDDTKVELMQISSVGPIRLHHIHWATQHGEEMQAWYAEHLGVTRGTRVGQPAGDLPGVNLTFGPSPDAPVPTQGRTLDHIGFEVKNLEEFCRRLEASGIKLDTPYRQVPALGIGLAFLTDPWGTRIELTEGLVNAR
jgi:catechol 2,3-dioxygenase-like lactoylglutathione lyase family enzyme